MNKLSLIHQSNFFFLLIAFFVFFHSFLLNFELDKTLLITILLVA